MKQPLRFINLVLDHGMMYQSSCLYKVMSESIVLFGC
jgi:hypothetical protein